MTLPDGTYKHTFGRGRSLPPKRNPWQRLMIRLGLRSSCCYGKIDRHGWRRQYCFKCQRRIW